MKTADLIAGLAAGATVVTPASPTRHVGGTAVAGCVIAFAILLSWLGLRPLASAVHLTSFWMKAGYTAALGAGAWGLAARLSRPAASLRAPLVSITFILVLMAVMAVMELSGTPARDLKTVWLGHSWNQCPVRIAVLAVPIYVLVALAVRQMAPTRLRAAGAAAGLLAGAAAATVYGLACDETTAAFTATWYTLGIGACAAVGAIVGPRLLRW